VLLGCSFLVELVVEGDGASPRSSGILGNNSEGSEALVLVTIAMWRLYIVVVVGDNDVVGCVVVAPFINRRTRLGRHTEVLVAAAAAALESTETVILRSLVIILLVKSGRCLFFGTGSGFKTLLRVQ
jgi:hypothetical protein